MAVLTWILILSTIYSALSWNKGFLLGCYKDIPNLRTVNIPGNNGINNCINECSGRYYRYVQIQSDNCICGNYKGEQVSNTTCSEYCSNCDQKSNLADVFATGNLVPGPPRNVIISNITDTSLKISWIEPESFVELTSYQIKAKILHTYSSFPPISPEWVYSNNTFQIDLILLHPSTKYNITLRAISPHGDGAIVFSIIQTKIAEPDNPPSVPEVVSNDGSQITIKMMPTTNNNGPITAYRIVVVNEDTKEGFDKNSVLSYDDARKNGQSYYIAAEIGPKDVHKIFTVGDGKTYGGYRNPALDPGVNYNILLGVVSKLNDTTKVRYSIPSTDILLLNTRSEEGGGDNSALVIGLSIAIGLLSCLLVASIVGFIILRNRVTNRRQRLSDNQELTLQGPMIEVENNGYIPEEEHVPINHYKSLKQKLQTFTPTQIKIEPTNLLGTGKFGRVNSGTIHENNTLIPIAAYSIQDKKMSQETRKSMLQELDLLIKTGKHENIIELIGTCETNQMVIVALEYLSMNLKDLLLGSRDSLPGRFSSMSEQQAIDIAVQICKGMAHLESCKIIHKQICARSILISNGFTPKISCYGLAQYYSHNKIPDYTRWTAIEVFRGQPHNPKSDVWSFACLLWEICVLGGTPYGNVSNTNEIPERIMKGLRLPQLPYFSDDLYQTMLDCWQVDPDERPKFQQIRESLLNLMDDNFVPYLNFNLNSNFQYEQFYPDMELAVRPVF